MNNTFDSSDNAKASMYDAKRSYIYNKAFFEKFVNKNLKQAKVNAREAATKALDQIEAMKAELISLNFFCLMLISIILLYL